MDKSPQKLIEINRQLAKQLGWTPDDFGATDFNAQLLDNIAKFQFDRLIENTGIADERTYKALLGYAKGVEARKHMNEEHPNLDKLGSVEIFRPTDRRVVRSAPFTGKALHLTSRNKTKGLTMAIAEGFDTVVLPLDVYPSIKERNLENLRRLGYIEADLDNPWTQGRKVVNILSETRLDGLVIEVVDKHFEKVTRDKGLSLLNLSESIMHRADIPKAVMASIGVRPRRLTKDQSWSWKVCFRFDAAFPIVPGAFGQSPAEYIIGQSISEWAIFGKQKANWAFPVIEPIDTTTTHEIHRFRDWAQRRSIRGIGWRGPLKGKLFKAFCEPLPDKIIRIDYF